MLSTGQRRGRGLGRFRQRGFGVATKASSFLTSNAGSAEGLGPGDYTIFTGETTLWRHDIPSNKVQQFLSQHKSPKLCSFTSGTHSSGRGLGFHEVPGPGHYSLPNLWEDTGARGTFFGRREEVVRPDSSKPGEPSIRQVESRFGRDVKAAKDLQ